MADSAPPQPNRRSAERYVACFPGYVVLPDGAQRIAVIRDLSVSGVLLLMDTNKLQTGDPVKLELHIGEDANEFRLAEGRVVRVEEAKDADLWRKLVAVRFEEPMTMSDDEISRFNGLPPSLEVDPDSIGS